MKKHLTVFAAILIFISRNRQASDRDQLAQKPEVATSKNQNENNFYQKKADVPSSSKTVWAGAGNNFWYVF